MKNLISCKDINPDILFEILGKSNKDQVYLDSRKVLGLIFLNESTRTSNSLKSAIIKLGGGWLGLEGVKGSYLASKLDTIQNSIRSLSNYCDLLAVRGEVEEKRLVNISTPIINAGNDLITTPLWGIWLASLLRNLFGSKELKIGVYGMCKYSSPIKSYYNVCSLLGYSFFEDSIVDEVSTSDEIVNQIIKNGSPFIKDQIENFIGEIDLLIIADCYPEKDCNSDILKKFIDNHLPINNNIINKLKKESKIFVVEPYNFNNVIRSTINDEVLKDNRIINDQFNKQSVISTIGIIRYLLSI